MPKTQQLIICLLFIISLNFIWGHEGHHHTQENKLTENESIQPSQNSAPTIKEFGGRPQTWMQWVGSLHFTLLHFPIALISMTVVSELLFAFYKRPIFDYASRFMLIAAAILAAPTALLGLTYSYTSTYSGILSDFVWWHMWFGITTSILAILVAFLREYDGISKLYYTSLVGVFLFITITAFLGGGMTFGPYHMLPPL